MNRHQLHTIHAQFLQIRNLLGNTGKRARMFHTRGSTTGEVAHMHLVDHKIVDRGFQRKVIPPVKVIEHHATAILVFVVPVGLFAPHVTAHNEF